MSGQPDRQTAADAMRSTDGSAQWDVYSTLLGAAAFRDGGTSRTEGLAGGHVFGSAMTATPELRIPLVTFAVAYPVEGGAMTVCSRHCHGHCLARLPSWRHLREAPPGPSVGEESRGFLAIALHSSTHAVWQRQAAGCSSSSGALTVAAASAGWLLFNSHVLRRAGYSHLTLTACDARMRSCTPLTAC
mmetsp:Transcript_52464/g.135915  ORF Transcript_52464/g.135915 Transcript_52464/m.135915 type:complete len:188 (-) Transcript_52464:61-624(-)